MKILATNPISHDCGLYMYDSNTGWSKHVKLEREFDFKHMGGGTPGGERRWWPSYVDGCVPEAYCKILKDFNFHPDVVGVVKNNFIIDCAERPFPHSKRKLWEKSHDRMFERLFGDMMVDGKIWVEHHYAHILSGWISGGKDCDYGVALDGLAPGGFTALVCQDPFGEAEIIYENRYRNFHVSSFGGFFGSIGRAMELSGMGFDMAGKIMGAHAYGSPDWDFINGLNLVDTRERIHELCLSEIDKFNGEKSFNNEQWVDWLATMHKVWERTAEALFISIIPQDKSLVFSGGSAQNTVFNERLYNLYPKAHFVPHCYDGGLCFGVMYQLCKVFNQPLPSASGYPYLQHDEVTEKPSQETIQEIARQLAEGKIVGWHQGKGEIGPRALGNRSILMNPAIPDAKSILNSKIKHREHWRPYAASVLEECARDWFKTETPSPYMMRAIPVKEEKKSVIPAVTHKDGTCRIQTVNREQNAIFYDLISEFNKLTGIPMLLNTSLNIGGKPISGRPDRSLALLRDSEMDTLCVGNEISL